METSVTEGPCTRTLKDHGNVGILPGSWISFRTRLFSIPCSLVYPLESMSCLGCKMQPALSDAAGSVTCSGLCYMQLAL